MAVCYNNLWKLLIDKNMNKTELKEAAGISFNVMARMGKRRFHLKVLKKSVLHYNATLEILLRLFKIITKRLPLKPSQR